MLPFSRCVNNFVNNVSNIFTYLDKYDVYYNFFADNKT